MAIAEKPILDPEPSTPGIPLKKSTLAVLALLLLAMGLLFSLVLSSSAPSQQSAPGAKDVKELRRTGTDQALKDEEAEATKLANQKVVAGAASALASATPPAALPPLPPHVRRDDNTSALFDRKGLTRGEAGAPSGRDRDLELEAQTRMAKALVTDFDSPREDQRASGAGRSLSGPGDDAAGSGGQSAQPPSAAVRGQIDAISEQLRAAQAGGLGAAPKSKEDWVREYSKESGQHRVLTGYQAARRLVLRQGKVIPAVLGRQINSDLPGRITAYVSSNVYDTDGRLLIPMGASLIGKYDSGVQVGQSRIMFAFERLVLPNGFSFDLPAAPGADLVGAAGMTGDVDNHFFKMFGTSLLIAVLANQVKQPSTVSNSPGGAITAAGQVLSDVSKTILERNRVIQPTITVDQGTRINVEVAADMVFPEQYPLR